MVCFCVWYTCVKLAGHNLLVWRLTCFRSHEDVPSSEDVREGTQPLPFWGGGRSVCVRAPALAKGFVGASLLPYRSLVPVFLLRTKTQNEITATLWVTHTYVLFLLTHGRVQFFRNQYEDCFGKL